MWPAKIVLLTAIVVVTAHDGDNPGGSARVIDGNISEDTPQESPSIDWREYFGPQDSASEKPGAEELAIADNWKIQVRVVSGKSVKIPGTRNTPVTVVDGMLTWLGRLEFREEANYLIAVATPSWEKLPLYTIKDMQVSIADGPLADAVVPMAIGATVQFPEDPLVAVFELPPVDVNVTVEPSFQLTRVAAVKWTSQLRMKTASRWLGEQSEANPIKADLVKRIMGKADWKAELTAGSDIEFSKSSNKVTVLVDGEISEVETPTIDLTKQYLLCRLLPDSDFGFGLMIYDFDARVTSGDLKGVTLHFRSGRFHESFEDPLLAIFEVPGHVTLKPQVLPLEVVGMRVK
jgi:hypothetical protein